MSGIINKVKDAIGGGHKDNSLFAHPIACSTTNSTSADETHTGTHTGATGTHNTTGTHGTTGTHDTTGTSGLTGSSHAHGSDPTGKLYDANRT